MSKELEKGGLTVALISAMFPVAEQVRANRIVNGEPRTVNLEPLELR